MKVFWQQVLEIINPAAPTRPSYDFNDSFGNNNNNDGGSESIAILLNDFTEDPEEPPFDPKEFVRNYGEYMQEHYGRPAQYWLDLFCCMLPITVEITSNQVQTLHRYWWMPVNHPVTSILVSHRIPNCGEVDAGICGSCLIYPDSYVVEWMERILGYFKDEGIELQQPNKPVEPLK